MSVGTINIHNHFINVVRKRERERERESERDREREGQATQIEASSPGFCHV